MIPVPYSIVFIRRTFRNYKLKRSINEVDLIKKYLVFINKTSGILFDIGASIGSFLERFLDNQWSIYTFESDPNQIKLSSSIYYK
ncbi:MAG: hypothetical protein STSR0008_20680 [Ignavibacterium sp.]